MMTRRIRKIIIHCTAAVNGSPQTIGDIDWIHQAKGFKRKERYAKRWNYGLRHVGYHAVIHADGFAASGRHYDEWGAHVKGRNDDSIGISITGTDKFTLDAWDSLRAEVIKAVRVIADTERYQFPVYTPAQALDAASELGIEIKGHRDYSPDLNGDGVIDSNEWVKICPGFDVTDWCYKLMAPVAFQILPS